MVRQEFCGFRPTLGQPNCNITVKLYVKFNDNLSSASSSFTSLRSRDDDRKERFSEMNFFVKARLTNTVNVDAAVVTKKRRRRSTRVFAILNTVSRCFLLQQRVCFLPPPLISHFGLIEPSFSLDAASWRMCVIPPHIRLLTPPSCGPRICGYFLARKRFSAVVVWKGSCTPRKVPLCGPESHPEADGLYGPRME